MEVTYREVSLSVRKVCILRHPLSAKDEVSKLLRTLLSLFASIEMVAEAIEVPFEKIIAWVNAEISCSKKQDSGKPVSQVAAFASHDNIPKEPRMYRDRIPKNRKVVGFVCGRPDHFCKQVLVSE